MHTDATTIPCALCGQPFARTRKRPDARYCSRTCSGRARRRHAPRVAHCQQCGRAFPVRFPNNPNRYCSGACGRRAQPPRPPKPEEERARTRYRCHHCGHDFLAFPSMRVNATTYCSTACYHAARAVQTDGERTCAQCGQTKPWDAFVAGGLYRGQPYRKATCKTCHNAHQRRQRADHPNYHRAHLAVYHAVRAGTLERPPCWCGATQTEAHHHRGYAPAQWLDVVWRCRKHHRQLHTMRS